MDSFISFIKDKSVFYETDFGTPQGGVISSLIANSPLNGIETSLGVQYRKRSANNKSGFRLTLQDSTKVNVKHPPRSMIRYADDFIVLCKSKEDAISASIELKNILLTRGVELSAKKTNIAHITTGFELLCLYIITGK